MRSRLTPLLFVLPFALATMGGPAEGSVSIAIPFQQLVANTRAVGVFMPVEQKSVWEEDRIVTYTRCRADEAIAGDVTVGSETWVATLGGRVGDIAQWIDGEPVLRVGRPAFLFLRDDVAARGNAPVSGIRIVTARAQGQYRVDLDPQLGKRLTASVGVGLLFPPKAKVPSGPVSPQALASLKPALAQEVLTSRSYDDAVKEIRGAWPKTHGAP